MWATTVTLKTGSTKPERGFIPITIHHSPWSCARRIRGMTASACSSSAASSHSPHHSSHRASFPPWRWRDWSTPAEPGDQDTTNTSSPRAHTQGRPAHAHSLADRAAKGTTQRWWRTWASRRPCPMPDRRSRHGCDAAAAAEAEDTRDGWRPSRDVTCEMPCCYHHTQANATCLVLVLHQCTPYRTARGRRSRPR